MSHQYDGIPPEEEEDALERWRRLRDGRGAPPRAKAREPKLDIVPITHAEVDQRIEAALESARGYTDQEVLNAVTQVIGATSAFAEAVADSNAKHRDELASLKLEVARLTNVASELSRALDAERSCTASGDVVSLSQRRQSH
jgi:hypothetical protein